MSRIMGFGAWRRRTAMAAVFMALAISGAVPSAGSRAAYPRGEASSAEADAACVAHPLAWDPHLDWAAGPPC